MKRYRNFVTLEQMKELIRSGQQDDAVTVAETIDITQVRGNSDVGIIADLYIENGLYERGYECLKELYRRKKSRSVLMQLINISVQLKKADAAERYYRDYKDLSGDDFYNYIFRYNIDKIEGKPIEERIASLEKLKEVEYIEIWAYELAKLYHKAGMGDKCVRECEDIEIWFGEGVYVDRARALKAYYKGEIDINSLSDAAAAKKATAEHDAEADEKFAAEQITEAGEKIAAEQITEADEKTATEQNTEAGAGEKTDAGYEIEDVTEKSATGDDTVYDRDMTVISGTENEITADADGAGEAGETPEQKGSEESEAEPAPVNRMVDAMFADTVTEEDNSEKAKEDNSEKAEEDDSEKAGEDAEKVGYNNPEKAEEDVAAMKEESVSDKIAEEPGQPEETGKNEGSADIAEVPENRKDAEAGKNAENAAAEETRENEGDDFAEDLRDYNEEMTMEDAEKSIKSVVLPDGDEAIISSFMEEEQQELARNIRTELEKDNAFDEKIRRERENRQNREKPEIFKYTPPSERVKEIDENSFLGRFLKENDKEFEEYFRQYVFQPEVRNQIIKTLEILLNPQIKNICAVVTGSSTADADNIVIGLAAILYESGIIRNKPIIKSDGQSLEAANLKAKADRLIGSCYIIRRAGKMKSETVETLYSLRDKLEGKASVILTDEKSAINGLFRDNRDINSMFPQRIHIPEIDEKSAKDLVLDRIYGEGYVLDTEAYDALSMRIRELARNKSALLEAVGELASKAIDGVENRNARRFIGRKDTDAVFEDSNVIIAEDIINTDVNQ